MRFASGPHRQFFEPLRCHDRTCNNFSYKSVLLACTRASARPRSELLREIELSPRPGLLTEFLSSLRLGLLREVKRHTLSHHRAQILLRVCQCLICILWLLPATQIKYSCKPFG